MSDCVVLRPTVAADLEALAIESPCRIRGITAVRGNEVLGIGGIMFMPGGAHCAFVHAAPGAHRYRLAFHKAGLRAIALARELGIRRLVASAESRHPRAEAWLARLGFRPHTVSGVTLWVWEDHAIQAARPTPG